MLVTSDLTRDPRVTKEARLARESGFDVTVICRTHSGEAMPYEVVPLGIGRGGSRAGKYAERVRINWRMVQEVVRRRPGIVHANDLDTLPAGYIGAKLVGARLVYDAHELWVGAGFDVGPIGQRIACWVEKSLAKRADSVVAVTPPRARAMVQRLHIPMPTVVMNAPFYQSTALMTPKPWRQGFAGGRVVLFQGLYVEDRDLEEAILASQDFPPNSVLALRGYGPLEPRLREMVDSLSLKDRVFFLEPVPVSQVVEAAVGADLGLVSYKPTNENNRLASPNKLFEYIMAGVPCVGTDLPFIRDVVDRHDLGFIYEPGNPKSLARAVAEAFGDPTRLEALRLNCLRAAAEYCWENEGTKLIAEYRRLSGQMPAPQATPRHV